MTDINYCVTCSDLNQISCAMRQSEVIEELLEPVTQPARPESRLRRLGRKILFSFGSMCAPPDSVQVYDELLREDTQPLPVIDFVALEDRHIRECIEQHVNPTKI